MTDKLAPFTVSWQDVIEATTADAAAQAASASLDRGSMRFFTVQAGTIATVGADPVDESGTSLDDEPECPQCGEATLNPAGDECNSCNWSRPKPGELGPPQYMGVDRVTDLDTSVAEDIEQMGKAATIYAGVLDELDDSALLDIWRKMKSTAEAVKLLESLVDTAIKTRMDNGVRFNVTDHVRLSTEPSERWANPDHSKVHAIVKRDALAVDATTGEALDREGAVARAIDLLAAAYLSPSSTPKPTFLVAHGVNPHTVMDKVASGRGWNIVTVADESGTGLT